MRLLLCTLFIFISFFIACGESQSSNTETETSSKTTAPEPEAGIVLNDLTMNMGEGLWLVSAVFERTPTPRYQAQRGRFYKFELNGDYALFDANGSILHYGRWSYFTTPNEYHYIDLKADKAEYNNRYQVIMSSTEAVFVGTEKYNNGGVQQKLEKLTSPPKSAIDNIKKQAEDLN